MSDKQKEMLELAKPLMKWLNDNYDPHTQVTVCQNGVELSQGILSAFTDEFLKD